MAEMSLGGSAGIAFLVAAGIVNEIIASDCSSPQTTELNAERRGGTLMKWVTIGVLESALFIYIAAKIDEPNRAPIIAGGVLAAGLKTAFYLHARDAGQKSGAPGTERW